VRGNPTAQPTFATTIKPSGCRARGDRKVFCLTPHPSLLTLKTPTVFDNPPDRSGGPKPLPKDQALRLAWSTFTPTPMVLETEIFFR
jgi:hypothetical protein